MRRPVPTALLALSLLLPLPALALKPHPARQKAPPPTLLGSAKEEPGEDAPVASARSAQDEADLSLLRALLFVFQPAPREIRVIAVEDLALLGDPRALDALAHLVLDPDPSVALAAVETVTHFQHPRAEEILGNVIRYPSLSPTLKLAAVRGLPLQGTASARALLTEISRSSDYAPALRGAAQTALAGR